MMWKTWTTTLTWVNLLLLRSGVCKLQTYLIIMVEAGQHCKHWKQWCRKLELSCTRGEMLPYDFQKLKLCMLLFNKNFWKMILTCLKFGLANFGPILPGNGLKIMGAQFMNLLAYYFDKLQLYSWIWNLEQELISNGRLSLVSHNCNWHEGPVVWEEPRGKYMSDWVAIIPSYRSHPLLRTTTKPRSRRWGTYRSTPK